MQIDTFFFFSNHFCYKFQLLYVQLQLQQVTACLQFPNLWCHLFEFNYTWGYCWFVPINRLFTIPNSVVFHKFHIHPTLSESMKLPQDHFV